MSVKFIGMHYPHPEHFAEFIERVHRVGDFLLTTPGCEGAEVWATPDRIAVVSTVLWQTPEQVQVALQLARQAVAADLVFDGREVRPRELLTLLPN